MARRYYSSTAARTTLASGVDDTTTTLSVVAVSGWPASYPYTLVIDQDTVNEELVEVSARTGTTLTVTRGVDGTSAVAHDAGAAVNHGVSARDFDEPNAFINGTGVVTETLLASGSVTEAKLGTGAVTSAKILDGTIVNADINASAAIAQSKIANLTSDLASKLDLAGGKILQVVRATDTTNASTNSTSYVDVAGMSVTISPQKATSEILVIASFKFRLQTVTTQSGFVQITDASNNPISGAEELTFRTDQTEIIPVLGMGRHAPATTSATTYKLRFKRTDTSYPITLYNSEQTGQMFAIEVSA